MRHHLALPLTFLLLLATFPAHAEDPIAMSPTPPGREVDCAGHQLLRPIMQTHTLPPYPQVSVMTSEQGTTVLLVMIAADGVPSDVQTVTSSGSLRLDDAARDFVKANWKWQPPLNDCKPVATKTRVSIKWDVRAAAPGPGVAGLSPSLLLDTMTIKVTDPSDYPASLPAPSKPSFTLLMVMVNASGKVTPFPITPGDPALGAKAVALAQSYRWPEPRIDGKPVGAIYPLMLVWPVPGQPIPRADDIKSVMSLFAPGSLPPPPPPK